MFLRGSLTTPVPIARYWPAVGIDEGVKERIS